MRPKLDLNKRFELSKIRFWKKVEKTPSCWIWTAYIDKKGYGQFNPNGISTGAHRFSYFLAYKNLPPEIDHTCRNTKCVNPSHLEAVSHRVNMLRGITNMAVINAQKTVCNNGHKLTPDNIYINEKGWRRCKKCAKKDRGSFYLKNRKRQIERGKRYYRENKEHLKKLRHNRYIKNKEVANS